MTNTLVSTSWVSTLIPHADDMLYTTLPPIRVHDSPQCPAQVHKAWQDAVGLQTGAEVPIGLLGQLGLAANAVGEGGVAVDHVPSRVVDGRGHVHAELVHRGLGLAWNRKQK